LRSTRLSAAKRQNDPDYHDNQSRAQRAWQKRNPDYWREYRREHPQYRIPIAPSKHERNARQHDLLIAKMEVSTPGILSNLLMNLASPRGFEPLLPP